MVLLTFPDPETEVNNSNFMRMKKSHRDCRVCLKFFF